MRRMTLLMMAGTVALATSCSIDVTSRYPSDDRSLTAISSDSPYSNISSLLVDSIKSSSSTMEEEYVQRVVAYHQAFKSAVEELGEQRENTANAIDSVWLSKQEYNLQRVYAVIEDYRNLKPPKIYQAIHAKYLEAMDKFEEGLALYRQGYEQGSSKMIESSRAPLNKGQDLWNYAYSNILITNEVLIGDGSLTNKDLKEMELLAGIDRDSVLLSISEDGKELSGHWRQLGEAKDIRSNLVLYEWHSYENIQVGEYSNMSHATFGRWAYDYLTGIVTIHVQAVYEDGKKQDNDDAPLRYEVQRFKDNQLQLMDLDTLQTYEYTKDEGL